MGMIRAWFTMGWLLAFATCATAQTLSAARDDGTRSRENSAPQPLNAAQEGSTAKGYAINVKIVQGRGLLERKKFPRGAVLAQLVPMPSASETASDPPAATAAQNSNASAIRSTEVKPEAKEDFWDMFVDTPEITVIAAPTIRVPENLATFIQVHNKKAFSYLVPTGDGTFRLEKTPPQELGLKLECTVKAIEGDLQSVELSPIEVSQTSLDGREIIDGVDLNVGKPILSTRSLKTAAKFTLGQTRVVTISADRDRQVLLLLKVNRVAN